MSKSVVVACDTGNDTIKVKVNNIVHYIPTIIKRDPAPRIIFGDGDEGDAIDYLDVSVQLENLAGNYHVGSLASYGINQESTGGFKSENKLLMVCMMTAIAHALAVEYPSDTEFDVTLGIGLPVNEFFWQNDNGQYDFSRVEKFKKNISGTQRVKFNTKLLQNKNITVRIVPDQIAVIPEGYAALSAILQNEQIDPDFVRFTRKNAISFSIDIGSKSCDVAAMMNGKYFPAGMFGFDVGMSEAIEELSLELRNKTGIKDITRFEVNSYLFDNELKGIYRTSRVNIDLNKEKVPHYKKLVDYIAHNFKEKLKENGVDINRIDVLFLVGGGSDELRNVFIDAMKNDITEFVSFEQEEARTKNLIGYEMVARKLAKS